MPPRISAAGETILSTIAEISRENLEKMKESLEKSVAGEESPEEPTQKQEDIPLPPPMAETLGISRLTLDTLYKIGAKLYEEDRLDDAISVFILLSMINNYSHEVWLSLAMCHHRAHEYIPAIQAYMTASLWQPNDPLPYLYCCECFIALDDMLNAKESLLLAESFLTNENKDRFTSLFSYCQSRIK